MLNNSGARSKRSKLERAMNFEILYCWLMLFGLCLVGSVGNGIWTDLLDDYRVCHLFCVRVSV
jgi:hypothetical protein